MFGNTVFHVNAQPSSPPRPPRVVTPRVVRPRVSSNARNSSRTPPRPVPRRVLEPPTDISISERYTNSAYNRQPSPMRVFQRPVTPGRGATVHGRSRERTQVTDRQKERVQLNPRVAPKPVVKPISVRGSHSEVSKRQSLAAQCEERGGPRPYSGRPKSSETPQPYKVVSETPSIEKKMFVTLKDVLSKAVLEKGKIDLNNIDHIMEDMRSRLHIGEIDDDEEPMPKIKVEVKESKMKVNVNMSSENVAVRKPRPLAGIMRKDIMGTSNKRAQGGYKKVYNRIESTIPKKAPSRNVMGDGQDTVVYIDLPDPDNSNFNSMIRKDEEKMKVAYCKKEGEPENIEVTVSKNVNHGYASEIKISQNKSAKEECNSNLKNELPMVGDCHENTGCHNFDFWKPNEDAKLQTYVETLVRSMNDQLNGKKPQEGLEGEHESERTVCKSFCVCKVCVSKNTSSKRTLLEEPPEFKGVRELEDRPRGNVRSSSIAVPSMSNTRQSRLFDKESNADSIFKVLKRNQNFQPESKVNITPNSTLGVVCVNNLEGKGSYTLVEPEAVEEAGEELYLQRRLSQTPARRKMTTRV